MVRVLANGEIDDGSTSNARQRANPSNGAQQLRNHQVRKYRRKKKNTLQENGAQGNPSSPSELFKYANSRLISLGLPRFRVAGYNVEPLHLILATLSLVFFGPMALIAVCIIIYVTQQTGAVENNPTETVSPTNQPSTSPRPTQNRSNNKLFSGSGQRLGS